MGIDNQRMRSLRNASEPRVWAKSKHHGPTSYDGPMVFRWIPWALIPAVAFGNPGTRREVFGMLLGFGVIFTLLWFFVGRNF